MSSEEQKAKIDFSNAKEPPRSIDPSQPDVAPLLKDDKLDDDDTSRQNIPNPVVKANISSG